METGPSAPARLQTLPALLGTHPGAPTDASLNSRSPKPGFSHACRMQTVGPIDSGGRLGQREASGAFRGDLWGAASER